MDCSPIPTLNLNIYQGDDKIFKFRYKDPTTPVDISLYSIFLECSDSSLDRTAVIDPDQVANTGEYEFVYLPADTENILTRRAKYDVVFYPTGLGGVKVTKHSGSLTITEEVA